MTDQLEISTIFGNSLFKDLSENLYPKKDLVFEELISNSIDAEASYASITFSNDEIIIKDNGEGLNEEELESFFSLAKSKKGESDETKIGKFGFGTISIRKIATYFEIESYKEGFVYKGNFDFNKIESLDKLNKISTPIFKDFNNSNIKHGFIIRIKNLSINYDEQDIIRLQTYLSRSLPLEKIDLFIDKKKTEVFEYNKAVELLNIKDFYNTVPAENNIIEFEFNPFNKELYLNGNQVIFRPKYNAEERRLVDNMSLNLKLKIFTGKICFSMNPINSTRKDLFGIVIKVLGRISTIDHIINYEGVSGNKYTSSRIMGEVNVNSLKKHIKIDRRNFDEDSEVYILFKIYLQKIYYKIARELYNDKSEFDNNIKKKEEEEAKRKRDLEIKEAKKRKESERLENFVKNLNSLKQFFNNSPYSYNSKDLIFEFSNQNQNKESIKKIINSLPVKLILSKGNLINKIILPFNIQIFRNRLNQIDFVNNAYEEIDFDNYYKNKYQNMYLIYDKLPPSLDKIFFEELILVINDLYKSERFSPAVILSRKLLENFSIEILKKIYGKSESNKYRQDDKYLRFEELLKNLKNAWSAKEIKRINLNSELPEDTVTELVYEIIEFKNKANSVTHNILNLTNTEDKFLELNIIHLYEGLIEIYNSI